MTGKPAYALNSVKPRRLLFQTAQDEIKAYILGNALKPGDALPPETELAQQLNISRNSLREAVKALAAVGILEARVGAGLFVRAFSFDAIFDNLAYGINFDVKKLSDVLELRHIIEYAMTPRVIQAATPTQIERLRAVLSQMREVAETGVYVASHDQAFHHMLYETVDNSVLTKILDVFWDIYRDAQRRVSMPEPADPMHTYQRHVEILAALEARDVAALQAAITRHWAGIQSRIAVIDVARQASSDGGGHLD
jgi:DNA-binding FadR family transcriptional regulator